MNRIKEGFLYVRNPMNPRQLSGYTENVVISFVDIYAKTKRNTKGLGIRQLTDEEMTLLAGQLV